MQKIIRGLFFLAGCYLLVNSVVLAGMISFQLGLLLTFLLGLGLLFYGIFFSWINRKTDRGFFKGLRCFSYGFLLFMLCVICFLWGFGQIDSTDYREDAVIVLGAGIRGETVTAILQYRLDKAVDYWRKNPKALFVVSGGQGPGESITEAGAMERYLLQKEVPAGQIVKEERSTSTYENFLYSKELLDSRLGTDYRVAFITNDFHIYRGYRLAREVGILATFLHAKTQVNMISTTYLREFAAVLKMWVFGP